MAHDAQNASRVAYPAKASIIRRAAAVRCAWSRALLAVTLIALLGVPASAADRVSGEDRHPLLTEICRTAITSAPSDDVLSLMHRAIGDVVWQGQTFQSHSDLTTAGMGDIRIKRAYYKELSRYGAHRAELRRLFDRKRAQLLAMQIEQPMQQALERVRFVAFEDFLDQDLDGMTTFFLGWRARGNQLELACGSTGLALSALYYRPDGVIVMCPGTELRLALGELDVSSLEFLIAHEIGHALDIDAFPDYYRQLAPQWDIHPLFLNESAADYWAAKTLANTSLTHLQSNLGMMCGLPEVNFGSLPYRSGDQRIDFILEHASES